VIDPFDLLRDQLATAAEAQPHGPRRRLPRPLWIAMAVRVGCGYRDQRRAFSTERWLKLDLRSKLNGLGLPVTTVAAKDGAEAPA
jgi:hypothetical protein